MTLKATFAALAALALTVAGLTGCGTSTPTPPGPSGSPLAADDGASATTTEGRFELVIQLPKTVWHTADAIGGQMALRTRDASLVEIGASQGGALGTTFAEVGGARKMEASFHLDCTMSLVSAAPVTSGLRKAGGWTETDPNAAFYKAFFADPDIHLPVGQWDISAVALFNEGGCGGGITARNLKATTRITVTP